MASAHFNKNYRHLALIFIFILLLSACAAPAPDDSSGSTAVLATTSIVADVVSQIAGDLVQVDTLIPPGTDPHAFEPAPLDLAEANSAAIIFANGAGLEEFLAIFLENAGASERVVYLSEDIPLNDFNSSNQGHEEDHSGDAHGDPHVWTDPANVLLWVDKIEAALIELDPAHTDELRANADTYRRQLTELDAWIRQQVDSIPPDQRKIVSDHQMFGYFAAQYGFEQIGAILPAYSTLAMPTAQELARLEDAITSAGVKAILVGQSVSPNLAERVAADTGVSLVEIYTGSLSLPEGPAATYLDYMRYNVNQITSTLRK